MVVTVTTSRLSKWMKPCNPNIEELTLEQINEELRALRSTLMEWKQRVANIVPESINNRTTHPFSQARQRCRQAALEKQYVVTPNIRFLRVQSLMMKVINSFDVDVMVNYGRREDMDVDKQLKKDAIISRKSKMYKCNISDTTMWKMYERMYHTIDVYHGNYGVDRAPDGKYDKQEEYALSGILAEVLFGMLMVKEGGSMIIKTYTFFTPETRLLLGMLRAHFDIEFTRTEYAKYTNSERFVICTNYRNVITYKQAIHLWKTPVYSEFPLRETYLVEEEYTGMQIKALQIISEILNLYKNKALDDTMRNYYMKICL